MYFKDDFQGTTSSKKRMISTLLGHCFLTETRHLVLLIWGYIAVGCPNKKWPSPHTLTRSPRMQSALLKGQGVSWGRTMPRICSIGSWDAEQQWKIQGCTWLASDVMIHGLYLGYIYLRFDTQHFQSSSEFKT